ncbi:hypothetical protein [Colwellia sp. 12G3]|uniref:hypothetical protein n=1 Tax=Colwellia sp. 12G3 TaxID=2058299 RepID=UPI0012FEC0EC|nr:hypothetical protein [Colwellia sp. 12G3]
MPEERRKLEERIGKLLRELTVAQQCSLSKISSYGYTLSFVRTTTNGKLAVVQLDDGAITVDDEGEIDHHPNIKVRN